MRICILWFNYHTIGDPITLNIATERPRGSGCVTTLAFSPYTTSLLIMAALAAKSEISLSKTCQKLGITKEGKQWLDLALDPFKDLNMPTSGFPDSVEVPSVVETIHDSFVVAAPTSSAGGKWDANIWVDQLFTSVPMYQTERGMTSQDVYGRAGQSLAGTRGGVQVRSGLSNVSLDQSQSEFGLSLKSDILPNAETRVIGIGLEIHNTTAELQRQGAIICYRCPSVTLDEGVATLIEHKDANTACIPSSVPSLLLTEPPLTASEAIDMPGSLQWEAKDGAYIVPVLNEPTNTPSEPIAMMPIAESIGNNDFYKYIPQLLSMGTAKLIYLSSANMRLPFSVSGCFLSGLSPETTLQVNLTYYVEVFPNKQNILRRIAQPSPPTDAAAMALYGKIIETLPVGCQVSDNFLGAFIAGVSRIAGAASQYLPQIGRVLQAGYQVAQGAFGVAQAVQNMADNRSTDTVANLMTRGSQQGSGANNQLVTTNTVSPQQRNQQLVVYNPPRSRDVVITNPRSGKTVVMNTGTKNARTDIAKKKHRNHINLAAATVRDGNRWIEHKHK